MQPWVLTSFGKCLAEPSMRISDQITLRLISEATQDASPISEILINNVPTGKRVEGVVLEVAVEWGSFCLLFLTDDIPNEEMLRVLLLDHNLEPVDSAVIGNPYSTGFFSLLELREPDTVRFRFMGGAPWRIQLLSRKRPRIPFFSEPPGVLRSLGFSRQFIIKGDSEAQG